MRAPSPCGRGGFLGVAAAPPGCFSAKPIYRLYGRHYYESNGLLIICFIFAGTTPARTFFD